MAYSAAYDPQALGGLDETKLTLLVHADAGGGVDAARPSTVEAAGHVLTGKRWRFSTVSFGDLAKALAAHGLRDLVSGSTACVASDGDDRRNTGTADDATSTAAAP